MKTPKPRKSRARKAEPAAPQSAGQTVCGPGQDGAVPPASCPCVLTSPDAACPAPLGQSGVVGHLQDIVRQSVAEGNMQHALKAIELLGKHLGMFRERAADKDEQRAEIRIKLDLGGAAEGDSIDVSRS